MAFYSAPFKTPKSLFGELLAPVDVFVDLFKLVGIDIGFTLSDDLKKEYGTGRKAIFVDMAASFFRPATLLLIVLALAVVAWRPLIRPAIANNLPNPAPVSNPVIVPPLSWPATSTPTATPTLTPTPTITPTPTPTPIVFASEEECDPIPDELEPALPFFDSLANFMFIEKEAFSEWKTGPGLVLEGEGNWLTLLADKVDLKVVYALERAEWEPFLDSNRYCLVGGQWTPLPPYEDLRHLDF